DQRVQCLEAGLDRLVHRLPGNDARCLDLDAAALRGVDRALAVDRVAEAVDDPAEQALADRHVDDRLGAADGVALADRRVGAEDDDADIVSLEVQRHALDAAVKLDHLARLDVVEAVDAGDAVADAEHGADFADLRVGAEAGDLLLDDLGNFSGADVHYLAFHRLRETVQFGADGAVDHAA